MDALFGHNGLAEIELEQVDRMRRPIFMRSFSLMLALLNQSEA